MSTFTMPAASMARTATTATRQHRAGCPCCSTSTPASMPFAARPATLKASAFNGKAIKASAPQQRCQHKHFVVKAGNGDAYYGSRAATVREHFPKALGEDDFVSRSEVALDAFGFNGENSIAMANMCRDEITTGLRYKIEDIFGNCFSTNGLGGCLTCGATGIGAGISHAPTAPGVKEKYVFFAFPHIAIDAAGDVGKVSRAGRPAPSSACGALIAATNAISSAEDLKAMGGVPGEHDVLDPELSILLARLARRVTPEIQKDLDLVSMTKICADLIADDLAELLKLVVDTDKADYAVITGTQIHNYGVDYYDEHPNLEFVEPLSSFVVIDGERTDFDLMKIPGPTTRQLRLISEPARLRQEFTKQTAMAVNGYDFVDAALPRPVDNAAEILPPTRNPFKKLKRALSKKK
mmetsp:Transcript_3422/g.11203  ORF Transcript_3422/g.11203 Transcript_3422/m.11203 type:complete len:409 (+) Transcript_3422:23-1249(+)